MHNEEVQSIWSERLPDTFEYGIDGFDFAKTVTTITSGVYIPGHALLQHR